MIRISVTFETHPIDDPERMAEVLRRRLRDLPISLEEASEIDELSEYIALAIMVDE